MNGSETHHPSSYQQTIDDVSIRGTSTKTLINILQSNLFTQHDLLIRLTQRVCFPDQSSTHVCPQVGHTSSLAREMSSCHRTDPGPARWLVTWETHLPCQEYTVSFYKKTDFLKVDKSYYLFNRLTTSHFVFDTDIYPTIRHAREKGKTFISAPSSTCAASVFVGVYI